jgi:protein involved in polysaccharide export with SLBB domain
MIRTNSNHTTSWSLRLLCLLMASLTACSTARPQYVWHDLGAQGHRDATQTSPILQKWGADAEGPNVQDPMIAPGFLLTMNSLTDSKLNGDFRVDFEGGLQLPYDLTVNTTGVTLSQLKKKLAVLYHPYFKTTLDIDLHLKERRYWVDVRGLVQKPGRYLVEPNASLEQVIGQAGGTDKDNSPQFARIQKGQKLFILDMNQYYGAGEDQPQILGWLGGELVFLQKEYVGSSGDRTPASPYRLPIYMLGEVRKPGEYPLKPGSDFVDTLTQANGFTEQADLDHIEIIRRNNGRKRVYEFSWNQIQRAPTPVQGDIFLVHADRQSKAELKLQIAAILVSIITSAAIVYELDRTNNR